MTNEELDRLAALESRLSENMTAVADYAIKLEEMTGWRNELGFRYNAEKQKTAKLRAALADCLQMSPLDPFERGEMIQRVLAETA